MRLFVAAELPPSLLEALCETQAGLRDVVSGRFVGSDLFHVTLAFLGETPAAQVDDVAYALDQACGCLTAFRTSLGELGTFGRNTHVVLWQGFDGGAKSWQRLARCVRDGLAQEGFAYDEHRFVPHVTLMRRASVPKTHLPMPCVSSGHISSVALYLSDLSGARPQYEVLHRVLLAGE